MGNNSYTSNNRPRRRKRKKKHRGVKRFAIFSFFLMLASVGGWFYVESLAYKVCRVEAGVEVTPSDFLKNADENAVFTMDSEPFDIRVPGEYHIKVKSGLFTHSCTLIIQDTIPPTADVVRTQVGIGTACRAEKLVANIVDATAVSISYVDEPDYNKPGLQMVQILLSDRGQNFTIVEAELYVIPVTSGMTVTPATNDEDEVNRLADSVLEHIITSEMSDMDKVEAIYNYTKSHIGYINNSAKGNWVKAAYEGLATGRGDCYVYACTAKVLLTRAGITNMDIAKIPDSTEHYWNLVDIGDGWYHLDATPRVDHPTIFMWTDSQLMEYSKSHDNSHNYDHEIYPVVN